MDYWIISTDYDHYSLVYGCTIPDGDVCTRAHAWMWSRERTLEEKYYDIMISFLPQLCLNESDFLILPQGTGRTVTAQKPKVLWKVLILAVFAFFGVCVHDNLRTA